MNLTLSILPDVLAVCRLDRALPLPEWSLRGFFSITRTNDELSIVCPQANVPLAMQGDGFEGDWRCFKVEGWLDFGLTDILVAIAAPLADAGISIFAVSTYETDYVLVKQRDFDRAMQTLVQAGHQLVETAFD